MAILGHITVRFQRGRVRVHKAVDREGQLHIACADTDRIKPYVLCKKPTETVISYDTEYMTPSQARRLALEAAHDMLIEEIETYSAMLGEAYAAKLDIIDRLSVAKTKGKLKEKAPVCEAIDTVVVDCANMGQAPFLI